MNDGYLWDRSGEPDPEVQALEETLARFAHDGRPAALPADVGSKGGWSRWTKWAVAAAVLVAAVGAWMAWDRDSGPRVFAGEGVQLALTEGTIRDVEGGRDLERGFEVVTRSTLELTEGRGDAAAAVGRFVLAPGSRVAIDTLTAKLVRLSLDVGRLEAFVTPGVPARLVQWDAPSGRCVDLGCTYVLAVDSEGNAHVAVGEGQVSLESGDQERYVPGGAECRASRQLGLGTPRFGGATLGLDVLLDRFDAAAQGTAAERRALALEVSNTARAKKDTLALWHMLGDADGGVRRYVESSLWRIAGAPPGVTKGKVMKGVSVSREDWREHLEKLWQ